MFFAEFPFACETFIGPHSMECLTSIWKSSGCKAAGYKYPANLDDDVLSVLSNDTLR